VGKNDPVDKWHGWINAVDPATGKMRWRVNPTPICGSYLDGGNAAHRRLRWQSWCLMPATARSCLAQQWRPDRRRYVTYEKGGKQSRSPAATAVADSPQGSATILIFAVNEATFVG
jgi:hypothetical protein